MTSSTSVARDPSHEIALTRLRTINGRNNKAAFVIAILNYVEVCMEVGERLL